MPESDFAVGNGEDIMINIMDSILKIILAVFLGLIVGLEREKSHKPAGLRTHILVTLGSTVITIVSLTFVTDSARLASTIITGIGFVGAGTIIASGKNIIGLTTAANLLVMSAIGIAIGVGEYALAIITGFVVLLVLVFGKAEKEEKVNNQERKN